MNEKKKVKSIRGLILFAGLVCLGVIYIKDVCDVFLFGLNIVMPFVIGGCIAFVLNLPMNFIEKKLLKWWKKKGKSAKRGVSILLSIIFVLALITFLILMVVPQLGKTLSDLGTVMPAFFQSLYNDIQKLLDRYPELTAQFPMLEEIKIDWPSIINQVSGFLKDGVSNIFTVAFGIAGSIANGVFDTVIAFAFAIYLLASKERIGNQVKRVITAYLPERGSNALLRFGTLCGQNFSRFISGQCLEAIILGSMFVIAMTIFRFPYAVMVGTLIAFTALIPIIGAFIGCIVGAFLILMVSPIKAVGFIIMFLVLQQIEGNLIYPRVVGSSVGLPAIWVLFAVSVGGSMFGIMGMLMFIPLMSTFYLLLRENVNERNKKKQEAAKTVKPEKKVKQIVQEEKEN